jgi:serine/threonine protein kinase/Flp pilus assembly protein TadD
MDDPTITMDGGDSRPSARAPAHWGPFRLIEKVGQGGFGQVYRAWDSTLEREVALKLLLPRDMDQGEEGNAVLREARLMARVRHANVVPVYGVDRHDGRVGFWSDFVRGKTLSALLAAQGPFGYREAALIGIELCKALSAVHAAGLLHRDIKTGNAMREEGGRILLMDFGLSDEHDAAHRFGGTPIYLAPELLAGAPASVSSDIYALGVLLYHLVTAKYPVEGTNLQELKAAHESGSRRTLLDERPDLPERFVQVIETTLDRDPQNRYATAGQMVAALSAVIGMSGDSVSQPPAPTRRRAWLAAPAIGALALVVAISPLRNRFISGRSASVSVAGAHADYLNAQDLLDHYYKPRNIENAIPLFQKTISEDPRFALAHAGLGRAYFLQYRDTHNSALIEKSQAACAQALAIDRDLAFVHVTLGMLYTETSRNDLAAQELQEALRLDARNAEAYGALAELYNKQGRKADVIPNYLKASELGPGDWRWPNQLGYYYLTVGNMPSAIAQFEQAVKATPANARAYTNLGIGYARQDRLPEARAAYEKAIELDPTFNRFTNLGTVLSREGKYAEAVETYLRSIDLNPSNYLAWANLASVYDRVPNGGDKARDAYVKAIALAEDVRSSRPKDTTVVSLLGVYYARLGMSEKSVPLMRQAAALAPDDPSVLYRLAEGYELLHHREEALRWIGRALAAGFSLETVKRNPELSDLTADPKFRTLREKMR